MTGTARANGIEIAYETFGSPEGRPLLLVMGLGVQMLSWPEEFCAMLADRGHFVVRFDNRDVGLSTHLQDAPRPDLLAAMAGDSSSAAYTLDDMADDTVGLMDALDVASAHLVGASMGGMIAQTVAIRHPERVRSLTSVMSTTGDRAVGGSTPEAQDALLSPPPKDREDAARRSIEAWEVIGSPAYPLDADAVGDVARRSFDRGSDPAGMMRQLVAIHASGDRTAGLRSLDVPAVVIHGEADPLIAVSGGRATAEAIPGARLLTLPGMGHDLPEPLWEPIVEAICALTDRVEHVGGSRPTGD